MGARPNAPLVYLILKAIHVFAVVIFLGNITVGIFWKSLADRTHDAAIMAYTVGGIIRADRIFTIPAIIVLLAAGFALTGVGGIPILGTGWLLWSIGLFILAGLAFAPLSRVQRQLHSVALAGLKTDAEQNDYVRLSQRWNLWGTIALVAPVAALVLMVLKPLLPAFHR